MTRPSLYALPASLDETIGEASARAASILISSGIPPDEAASDIRVLLAAASGLSTAQLIAREKDRLGPEAASIFTTHLARRQAREPVSRILGTRAFWRDEFHVDARVLDPRADTELIVSLACAAFATRFEEPLRILDLGTGSGALLCSLLREFPFASGLGLDLSEGACEVAHRNIEGLGLASRGRVRHSSWTDLPDEPWDIIVSNPPYIERAVIASLEPEVRLWDPAIALDGGPDGLDAYRSLALMLPRLLAHDGQAFLEIGYNQALTATEVMESGGLRVVAVHADLGEQPRVLEISR